MPATSPIDQSIDLITYDILLNGKSLEDSFAVESITVDKTLNKIATAELVILDGDPATREFELMKQNKVKPGTEVEIKAGYHLKNETIFKGIIVKASLRIREGAHSAVVVYCADKAIKMTLLRKSQYFLKKKDSDVIGSLIGDSGLSKKVDITSFQHKEIIQYHATDWDFMISRAEVNGLVVLTDDGTVNVVKPAVSGSPVLSLTYGSDIIKTNLSIDSSDQLSGVECSSWDMGTQNIIKAKAKSPALNGQGSIKAKDLAGVISRNDLTLHVTGPEEKASLASWADARLLKSGLSRIRGSLTFPGYSKIKPNALIELEGLGEYFNGNAYISGVRHEISEGIWITEAEVGLPAEWYTETRPDVSVPAAAGLLPGIEGLYNGKVKKINEDPDKEHRVLVDIPVIEPNGDGVWARLSNLYASKNVGSFFYPEVGDEVILGFLNNDPRYPVILGMLYSKKIEPPYTADNQNSTKAFVTKNNLKIVFEDKEKNIVIETPAGNKITISDQNKSIILQDQNKNKVEMSSSGIKLDTMKDVTIAAKGKVDIQALQGITLKATAGDVTLDGLNVKGMAKIQFSAQGTMAELKGSATTMVKGAIVMIN